MTAGLTRDRTKKIRDAPKQIGTIKSWNEVKGYGFITTDDYRDIFAHISPLIGEFAPLKNDTVQFVEGVGKDGRPFARSILIVSKYRSQPLIATGASTLAMHQET